MNHKELPKIALIGPGRWGLRMLQILSKIAQIKYVGYKGCEETKRIIKECGLNVILTTDLKKILNDQDVSYIFITTPIETHAQLVMSSLSHGKHTFVEKPLSVDKQMVEQLYAISTSNQLSLMTGYIYLHDPALKELKQRISDEICVSIELDWAKWGTFDSDIITNLLVHELAILHYLLGPIESVQEATIESDTVFIKAVYKGVNVTISIDRKNKTKRKQITCSTLQNDYQLSDGFLLKGGQEIHRDDQSVLMNRECISFLSGKSDYCSRDIDLGVADALALLNAKN